jgi:hypothetical protein
MVFAYSAPVIVFYSLRMTETSYFERLEDRSMVSNMPPLGWPYRPSHTCAGRGSGILFAIYLYKESLTAMEDLSSS